MRWQINSLAALPQTSESFFEYPLVELRKAHHLLMAERS